MTATRLHLDEDALIERAKKAYYSRAARDLRDGIHWNQLPEGGWEYLFDDRKDYIVCYHGGLEPVVKYRWTGSRMIACH